MITIKDDLPKTIRGNVTVLGNNVDRDTKIADDENIQAGGFVFKTNDPKRVVGLREDATSDDVLGVAIRTPFRTPNNPNGYNYYAKGADISITRKGSIAVKISTDSEPGDKVYVDPSTGIISSESALTRKISFSSGEEATPAILTFPNISSFENWKVAKTGFFELVVDDDSIKTYIDFSAVSSILDIADAFNDNRDLSKVLLTSITSDRLGLEFTTKSKGKDSNISLVNISSPFDSLLLAVKEDDGSCGGINPAQLKFFYEENDYYLDNYRAVVDGTITILIGDQTIESSKIDFSRINNLSDVASKFNNDDNLKNLLTCEHISEGNKHYIIFSLKNSTLGSNIVLKDWSNYKMLMAITGSKYSEHGTDSDVSSITINVNSDILGGIKNITSGRVNFGLNDEFLFVEHLDFSKVSNIRDIANVFNSNETFASRFSCEMGDVSEDEYGSYIEIIFKTKDQGKIDIVDLSSPMFDLFTRKTNQKTQSQIAWTQGKMPTRACWSSIIYGNGKFVAVSNLDSICAYSTDGITWIENKMPTSDNWKSVTYGDGKFVAVARKSDAFAYSTDGVTWTQGKMPVSAYWKSVTYGDSRFVAVSESTDLYSYSVDGITWIQGKMPVNTTWTSVVYNAGIFLALAEYTDIYAHSVDGIIWTKGKMPVSAYWKSVTYGDGKFVAVASNTDDAAYSTDGITWIQGQMPVSGQWYSVTYEDGVFVAVAEFTDIYAYSVDGITWTKGTLPAKVSWSSIAYGDGKFVAVAFDSDIYASGIYETISALSFSCSPLLYNWKNNTPLAIKLDNIVWVKGALPGDAIWNSVAYGDGKFVAVNRSNNKSAYSVDGVTWTQVIIPGTDGWWSITYVKDRFIAMPESSDIFAHSVDCITWTEGKMPVSNTWSSVAYGDGKFVAVASQADTYAYSLDGITWTEGKIPVNIMLWSVAYGNGKFVAVDNGGGDKYVYSTDGITWTQGKLPINANWSSVIYGGGKFVAVSSLGIVYSVDGITWSRSDISIKAHWYSVAYGDSKFVVVAYNSDISAYSVDGITWTKGKMPVSAYWKSVTYGDGKFVAVSGENISASISAFSTEELAITEDLKDADSFETIASILETSFDNKFNFNFNSPKNDRLNISPSHYVKDFNLNFLNFSIANSLTWTKKSMFSSAIWQPLEYCKDKFLSFASDNNIFTYSTNGLDWEQKTLPAPFDARYNWRNVTYGDGKFVAVGYGKFSAYSTDGINWERKDISSEYINWFSVAYGNNLFIAKTYDNVNYVTSQDGQVWSVVKNIGINLPEGGTWQLIRFVKDRFIVLINTGNVYAYSVDGITWNQGTLPAKAGWRHVAYGNGRFVVVGAEHASAYSTDGVNWTAVRMPINTNWRSISYGNGMFVAIAYNSDDYSYSYDGENWKLGKMSNLGVWNSVAYGDGRFLALADLDRYSYANVIDDDPRTISKVLGWKTSVIENATGNSPYADIPGFCNLERIKTVKDGEISITVNNEKLEAKGLDFSDVTEETVSDVFSNNEALRGKVNVSLNFNESENTEHSMFKVWRTETGSNESITDIKGLVNVNDIMGNIMPMETKKGSISPKTPATLTFPYALDGVSVIKRWETITRGELSLKEDENIIKIDGLDFSNINSIEDILKVFEKSLNDRLGIRITSNRGGLEFSTNRKGEGTTLVYLDSSDDVFKNLGAVSYEEGTGGDEPHPGDVIDTGFKVVDGGKAGEDIEIKVFY